MCVINRRSDAKPNNQCDDFFERPARLRELAQEVVAGLLAGGPDIASSLADHPSDDILKRVTLSDIYIYAYQ